MKKYIPSLLGILLAVFIAWVFLYIGGPSYNQSMREDRTTRDMIKQLNNSIKLYALRRDENKKTLLLPPSIDVLYKKEGSDTYNALYHTLDEYNYSSITYKILNAEKNQFEICANFAYNADASKLKREMLGIQVVYQPGFWHHKAGHTCFKLELRNTTPNAERPTFDTIRIESE